MFHSNLAIHVSLSIYSYMQCCKVSKEYIAAFSIHGTFSALWFIPKIRHTITFEGFTHREFLGNIVSCILYFYSLAQLSKASLLYPLFGRSRPHHCIVCEHMQSWWQNADFAWLKCGISNEACFCSGIQSNRRCYLWLSKKHSA